MWLLDFIQKHKIMQVYTIRRDNRRKLSKGKGTSRRGKRGQCEGNMFSTCTAIYACTKAYKTNFYKRLKS